MITVYFDADGNEIKVGDTIELLTHEEAHDDVFKTPLIGLNRRIIEFGRAQIGAPLSAIVKNTMEGYAYWPLPYVRCIRQATREARRIRSKAPKLKPKVAPPDPSKIQEPKWPLKRIKKRRKPQPPPMGLPISRWMDLD